MRGALITEPNADPVVSEDVADVHAGPRQVLLAPAAAAVNPIDLVIAAGALPVPPSPLPYVPGREGVGEVLSPGPMRGKRVWFEARGGLGGHGSMAERAVAEHDIVVELPPRVDELTAARYGIAGTAAWLALTYRGELAPGETVAVLAASGAVGQIAVQAARVLGAGRVVAVARGADVDMLASRLGADAAVALDGDMDTLPERYRDAAPGGLDVIIDPLWGPAAMAALECANDGARLVQMGSSATSTALVSGFALRSQTYTADAIVGRDVSIVGHTNMAVPALARAEAYRQLIARVAVGSIDVPAVAYPLDQVAEAFRSQATSPHHKIVIEL